MSRVNLPDVSDFISEACETSNFGDDTVLSALLMLLGDDITVHKFNDCKFLHSDYTQRFYNKPIYVNVAVGNNWTEEIYNSKLRLAEVPYKIAYNLKKAYPMSYPEFFTTLKFVGQGELKGSDLAGFRKTLRKYEELKQDFDVQVFQNNVPDSIALDIQELYKSWYFDHMYLGKMLHPSPQVMLNNLDKITDVTRKLPLKVLTQVVYYKNKLVAFNISEWLFNSKTVRTIEAKKARGFDKILDLNKLTLYIDCKEWLNILPQGEDYLYSLGMGNQVQVPRGITKHFCKSNLESDMINIAYIDRNFPFFFEEGLNINKKQSGSTHMRFPFFVNCR